MGIAWVLVLAAVITILQSFVLGRWALSRLSYTRQFNVSTCFAGDTIEMVEVIENAKPLPVLWLRTESTIDAHLRFQNQEEFDIDQGQTSQHHKSLFTLMPYRRIRRRHKVYCSNRGIYQLESVSITGGDALGMQVKSKSISTQAKLTVYPQIIPMQELPIPSHDWQGDVTVRRWIMDDPFLVSGVRPYRNGDPMNRISWKATARTNHLQVQQHEYTADQRLYIYVNVELSETMRGAVTDQPLIEKGLCYAATLASEAIANGLTVGFGHNAHSQDRPSEFVKVPSMGGREHLMALFEVMTLLEMKHRLPFHQYLEEDVLVMAERRDYMLITAHLSESIQQQIDRLRLADHSVQILRLEKESSKVEEVAG
jgi:uncharacterized protein (DUF58 family)